MDGASQIVNLPATFFWATILSASVVAQLFTLWILKNFQEFRRNTEEMRLIRSFIRGTLWASIFFISLFYEGKYGWLPFKLSPDEFPHLQSTGWIVVFTSIISVPLAIQLIVELIFKPIESISNSGTMGTSK